MLQQSPSGLFTRRAWERELEASYERMPAWYWSQAESDRQFLLWVQTQAKALATALAARVTHTTPGHVAGAVETVEDMLWRDTGWARVRLSAFESEKEAA